ncbi:MAG: hypothetical protein HC915_21280, partial [Anaerolineae bacterium]|nr:hypothetical protein [Anaerolineae bacterium]
LPTPTYTVTPTETPSPTPTATLDRTATAAARASATAQVATSTAQALVNFFATRQAITPTLDIQQVLEACDRQYALLEPENVSVAPSVNQTHPRLIRNGQNWTLELVIQNTGTCDWPAGVVFLSFVRDANSDVSEFDDNCLSQDRIFLNENFTRGGVANYRIDEPVPIGEQVTIEMDGVAAQRFGCYFSTWELRIPDYDLFIGDRFVIAHSVFGGR